MHLDFIYNLLIRGSWRIQFNIYFEQWQRSKKKFDFAFASCQCKRTLKQSFLVAATNYSCSSNPCVNGATCVNSGDTFTCLCKDGFSGPTCAIDTNNCNPYPWCVSPAFLVTNVLISGGSRISKRGRQPQASCFGQFFPKTAWNWQKDQEEGYVPRAPRLRSATAYRNKIAPLWKLVTTGESRFTYSRTRHNWYNVKLWRWLDGYGPVMLSVNRALAWLDNCKDAFTWSNCKM